MWFREWVPVAGTLFQMAFFVVVGWVTVLTYLRARKTLLQPFRAKVFEEQIRALTTVLSLFAPGSDYDKRRRAAFDKLLWANAVRLFDTYAYNVLHAAAKGDEKPYSSTRCPASLITAETVNAEYELYEGEHIRPEAPERRPGVPDGLLTVRSTWEEFRVGELCLPVELTALETELQELIASPMLPKECVDLIVRYVAAIHANTSGLVAILTECAQELPRKYPDLKSLNNASLTWIEHRYRSRVSFPKTLSADIVIFVRSYLGTDRVFD